MKPRTAYILGICSALLALAGGIGWATAKGDYR